MLGLNQSARQGVMQHSAFPVYICRLTLAWISSETSTKLLGMPTYPDRSSSLLLDPLSCRLVTSAARCRLATRVTLRQLPSSSPFVQLPSRVPLPTSGHAETSSLKAFVWFRAKTDKGIVCLAEFLHSVTLVSYPARAEGVDKYDMIPVLIKGKIFFSRLKRHAEEKADVFHCSSSSETINDFHDIGTMMILYNTSLSLS